MFPKQFECDLPRLLSFFFIPPSLEVHIKICKEHFLLEPTAHGLFQGHCYSENTANVNKLAALPDAPLLGNISSSAKRQRSSLNKNSWSIIRCKMWRKFVKFKTESYTIAKHKRIVIVKGKCIKQTIWNYNWTENLLLFFWGLLAVSGLWWSSALVLV